MNSCCHRVSFFVSSATCVPRFFAVSMPISSFVMSVGATATPVPP